MRFRIVTVAILLAVASRGHGRPRDPDPLDSREAVAASLNAASRSGSPGSRLEKPRELKDIQSMDQSLRTVATQLLNATAKREDLVRIPEEKIVTIETPMQVVHVSSRIEDAINEMSNNEEDNTTRMKFGIPANSKFSHFEITNPGHALPLTEEEIEREMAAATISAQKHQPTTTSMLSTWIHLYPPSTTTDGNNIPEAKIDAQSIQIHSTSSTKMPGNIIKYNISNNKPNRKAEAKPTTAAVEKFTEPSISTTKVIKNTSGNFNSNYVKVSTTLSSTSIENDVEQADIVEKKPQNQQTTASASATTKSASSTKKPPTKNSTTSKPKVSTPKNPITKPPKGNNANRVKPFSTTRSGVNKNDTVTSTSKIEKVTFKPYTTPSQNRTETTDKPLFITKIKASILADTQKSTTVATTTFKPVHAILSKSNFTNSDSSVTKVPTPSRVNNILKVHLKKPIDDTTKIEIKPIKVNPPILTIEKIGESSSDKKTDIQEIPENSKIDNVKFDFNSDVEVYTSSTESILSSSTSTTTTKRPRASNKRKKNKNRRRKPATTTTTTVATPATGDEDTTVNVTDIDELQLTGIQESKIEPESKAPPSKKKPSHQTQIQKPIGTQIYNFLSREVMPSVGVMSLVGLGLGLASYFLYPFGGAIARRNYEVEPNYKYNLDEYGGNYGLSEEEVLSKVYSGMTSNQQQETKYNSPVPEKNSNYYRYSVHDQPQQHQPTRYPTQTVKNHANRVVNRPVETTAYDMTYRNTEFKYPDVPTTPNYYERQRQQQQQTTDFMSTVGKVALGHNRKFVVGNVPAEYMSSEMDKVSEVLPSQDKMDHGSVQYQANEGYADLNLPVAPLTAPPMDNLANPAALVSKVDGEQPAEVYEEVEITPAAVAVEHGPRSLKFDDAPKVESTDSKSIRRKRGILPDIAGSFIPLALPGFKVPRIERNSVIQVIPSKSEIEKERKEEEQEEDLSNEILDIIDEALPGKGNHQKKRYDSNDHSKVNAAVDKQHSKDHSVTSTNKDAASSTTTAKSTTSSASTTSSTTVSTSSNEKQAFTSASTSTSTTMTEMPTEPDFVDQGETTLDWFENVSTTANPKPTTSGPMDILGFAKRIAQIKLRLGLTILKHASENFARYIGHIQKRFNGEE